MKLKLTSKIEAKLNEELVVVEISDTDLAYAWRLVCGNRHTAWTTYYSGILTLRTPKGQLVGYATDYWRTVLPTEVPFLILTEKEIKQ